jgi:hypothetical protein
MADFPSIRPDETAKFTFDFAGKLGTEVITGSPVWTCAVSPNSPVADPTPELRIVSSPIVSGQSTSVFCGTMLDGVTYTLTAQAVGSGGSVVADSGDVECTIRSVPVSTVLTPEQFREEFPAFSNSAFYTDEQITFWIGEALGTNFNTFPVIDQKRWGQFYNLGLKLWVAHNLALDRSAAIASAAGRAPIGSGVVSSRSVGPVSVSYDTQFGSETDGGNYNLTTYGSRFLFYLRMAGAAPIQL